jgi:arsenical pump membrane protein
MSDLQRYTAWGLAVLAVLAVVLRPWRLPEACWPLLATLLIVLSGTMGWVDVWGGISDGADVYLFLAGMMLLAELARAEGLFDWLAAQAVRVAAGSAVRLFLLVYLIGVGVTAFLSNDATAVVLTPAVIAMTRAVRAPDPKPYLLSCALVANAASFVLPISNPANLVVYGARIPALGPWLARFTVPSLIAIAATLALLYATQRRALCLPLAATHAQPALARGARLTALGIALTAVALMAASAASLPLGLCTLGTAIATLALVTLGSRQLKPAVFSGIDWSIFPLVAGLFALVRMLEATGAVQMLQAHVPDLAAGSALSTQLLCAIAIALAANIANNLPVALFAGRILLSAHAGATLAATTLVAVDVGPNLSVTGSLATLLWLAALRREGILVTPLEFLRLGSIVMPAALLLAVLAVVLCG